MRSISASSRIRFESLAFIASPNLPTALAIATSCIVPPFRSMSCHGHDVVATGRVTTGRGLVKTGDNQGDFFAPAQLGLGLEDTRPDPTYVDPQAVREELNAILATAMAARDTAPWDRKTHRYHQVVFPQMANWLPNEEADRLRRQFKLELKRIDQLLAA